MNVADATHRNATHSAGAEWMIAEPMIAAAIVTGAGIVTAAGIVILKMRRAGAAPMTAPAMYAAVEVPTMVRATRVVAAARTMAPPTTAAVLNVTKSATVTVALTTRRTASMTGVLPQAPPIRARARAVGKVADKAVGADEAAGLTGSTPSETIESFGSQVAPVWNNQTGVSLQRSQFSFKSPPKTAGFAHAIGVSSMKISAKAAIGSATAALFLSAMPAVAQDQDGDDDQQSQSTGSFRLNTGVSYSSGDYGELEKTDVIAVPVSLTYKKDGLRLRVSVPWVVIDGPGSLLATPEGRDALFGEGGGGQGRGRGRGGSSDNSGSGSSNSGSGSGGNDIEVEDELDDDVIDDDDVVGNDGFAGPDQNRSGFGDVNVSALYSFELARGTYFEPQVKVKLPTASRSDRLGTGEVDVTLSADLVQEVGPLTLYGHGQRRFAGKPEGSTIRSTWGAGAGASIRAGGGVQIGADYAWQQSAFTGRQASSEVTGWVGAKVSRDISLTVYGGTGLNDNSAAVIAGAGAGFRF